MLIGVALAIMELVKLIPKVYSVNNNQELRSGTVAAGWQNFLICIEMLVAAVVLRYGAFIFVFNLAATYRDYQYRGMS